MNAKEGCQDVRIAALQQYSRGVQQEDDCRSEVARIYHLGVPGLLYLVGVLACTAVLRQCPKRTKK